MMKTTFSLLTLVLLTGCSASVSTPEAPGVPLAEATAPPAAAARSTHSSYRYLPGEMEMSWEPKQAQRKAEPKPRKSDAKPYLVSKKRRSLFALPSR